MKKFVSASLVLAVQFILTGCMIDLGDMGHGPYYDDDASPGSSDNDRRSYIMNYKIVDKYGSDTIPTASNGTRPFGVMFAITYSGVAQCTATHMSSTYVMVNLHCIEGSYIPTNYYFLHFDKSGKKRVSQVTSFGYRSDDKEVYDVAVLRISSSDAANWDTAGTNLKDLSSYLGKKPGDSNASFKVITWSFDPDGYHPGLTTGNFLMFNKRTCTASKIKPQLELIRTSGVKEIQETDRTEATTLFLEDCDSDIVHGNSGSVTTTENFSEKVGALFAYSRITRAQAALYDQVNFIGYTGTKIRIYVSGEEKQLYGTASDLQHLEAHESETIF